MENTKTPSKTININFLSVCEGSKSSLNETEIIAKLSHCNRITCTCIFNLFHARALDTKIYDTRLMYVKQGINLRISLPAL